MPSIHRQARTLRKLTQYLVCYAYDDLFCKTHRRGRFSLRGVLHRRHLNPFALLCEFRSDLRTCLHRMRMRVDRLPHQCRCQGLPSMEWDQVGDVLVCTASLDCIEDIESFAQLHPEATVFDFETYQTGWLAGYISVHDSSAGKQRSGANACCSPDAP